MIRFMNIIKGRLSFLVMVLNVIGRIMCRNHKIMCNFSMSKNS